MARTDILNPGPCGTDAPNVADASCEASSPCESDAPSSARAAYERYNRSWRDFDRVYSAAAACAGLSDSALDVLWVIYEQGEGVSQRDVCGQSYLGKQTVNSSVHKLAGQGILRLEPAASGRGVRLFLTEEGRALVERYVAPICQADFDAFASLPEHDRDELVRTQQAYLDALAARCTALMKPDAGPAPVPGGDWEPGPDPT